MQKFREQVKIGEDTQSFIVLTPKEARAILDFIDHLLDTTVAAIQENS